MATDFKNTLVVSVSSRALFDFENEAKFFKEKGLKAFIERQRKLEKQPLSPGPAFPLIKSLLSLNQYQKNDKEPLVEVIIVSNQHPDTGLRVMSSVQHHALNITRAAFTGGGDTIPYLPAFQTDLFLTKSPEDANQAVKMNVASAYMYRLPPNYEYNDEQLKIAFDGDAVLFSDESEAIFKSKGLEAFVENEITKAKIPMMNGPFGKLLKTLHNIKTLAPESMRIALVTARNAPSHERALRTLRHWKVDVDEALFLGGMPKAEFLNVFQPQIFFDDQEQHLKNTANFIPVAQVPCILHSKK